MLANHSPLESIMSLRLIKQFGHFKSFTVEPCSEWYGYHVLRILKTDYDLHNLTSVVVDVDGCKWRWRREKKPKSAEK